MKVELVQNVTHPALIFTNWAVHQAVARNLAASSKTEMGNHECWQQPVQLLCKVLFRANTTFELRKKKSSFASKLKFNFAEKAAAAFQSPLDLCKTREFGCFFLQVGNVSVVLFTVSTQRYTSD